jgi:hypothetical protein
MAIETLTEQQAGEFAAALRAEKVSASVGWHQYVTPENTVGKRWDVTAKLVDEKAGNMVVREVRKVDGFDAAKLAKEMRAELKDRARDARAHKKAERSVDRS